MKIDTTSSTPLSVQIAQGIEDAIISGAFEEEGQIPSTTEIALTYKINPGTAQRGIATLTEAKIIYKKRGLGMFVSAGAREKLRSLRKSEFFENHIKEMILEAKRLNLDKLDIDKMIERGFTNE